MLKKLLIMALILCAFFCVISCNNDPAKSDDPAKSEYWLWGEWIEENTSNLPMTYEFTNTQMVFMGSRTIPYKDEHIKTKKEANKFTITIDYGDGYKENLIFVKSGEKMIASATVEGVDVDNPTTSTTFIRVQK